MKRGVVYSFSAGPPPVATVILLEATNAALTNIPVSTNFSSLTAGDYCAVLFFDEQNLQDCVVIAQWTS